MADHHAHPYNRSRVLAIDDLPDDDLLAIFDFCVFKCQYLDSLLEDDVKRKIESWQPLVHVCRRWRCLVFGSAHRLNLQLFCEARITARMSLDVWPALPLVVLGRQVDSVIPELEHSNRISQIELSCVATTRDQSMLWTAMQVPFPELVALRLSFPGWFEPALPDSFLGGSAPRLRYLTLLKVPFPGLPQLLLSATHLVHLYLHRIPHFGYFSLDAMATCLSVLTSLEELHLDFQFPQSFPDQESRRPPPPTRSVLPALTVFWFKGVNKYSEDLLSRIDARRLYRLSITLFDDIDFDTPELNQLIRRTPTFRAYNEARLIIDAHEPLVRLQSYPDSEQSHRGMVEVRTSGRVTDRRLSSLAQICTSSLRFLLTMDNLYICEKDSLISPFWPGDVESIDWYIWPYIVPTLQELIEGRTTEVLPALQNVLLEGYWLSEHVPEGIVQFISARQRTNRPVAISVWDRN